MSRIWLCIQNPASTIQDLQFYPKKLRRSGNTQDDGFSAGNLLPPTITLLGERIKGSRIDAVTQR
jgi:hypothetical protein